MNNNKIQLLQKWQILKIGFLCIMFIQTISCYSQNVNDKTIHILRERKFMGSGNKMDIYINGKSVFKLKNGRHLIIHNSKLDTIDFQIIYPLMNRFKSSLLHLGNRKENELYFLVSYSGAGNEFRINLSELSPDKGKKMIEDSKRFKKKIGEVFL